MDFSSNKFRSYVYTGFELDKSAIQLIEDLRKVFGVDAVPWLRTVQPWIGTIKDGSISIEREVRLSGRSHDKGALNVAAYLRNHYLPE